MVIACGILIWDGVGGATTFNHSARCFITLIVSDFHLPDGIFRTVLPAPFPVTAITPATFPMKIF